MPTSSRLKFNDMWFIMNLLSPVTRQEIHILQYLLRSGVQVCLSTNIVMHAIQIQHRTSAGSGARGSSIHWISKPSKKTSTTKGLKKQSREEGKEYAPANYPAGTTVSFAENAEWDPSRLVAGTRKIVFERGFEAREYTFLYYSFNLKSTLQLI
jgi:hypothetical protein